MYPKIDSRYMSRVEQVEDQVKDLTPDELRVFREWFAQFDAELWDRQLAADENNKRLHDLAEKAIRDHGAGQSTSL